MLKASEYFFATMILVEITKVLGEELIDKKMRCQRIVLIVGRMIQTKMITDEERKGERELHVYNIIEFP